MNKILEMNGITLIKMVLKIKGENIGKNIMQLIRKRGLFIIEIIE